MSTLKRADDFPTRRRHLEQMSDDELHAYFWALAARLVAPLVEQARSHTTPSIERSVLLRMGFSSLEAKAIVDVLQAASLLGRGAGRVVLELARTHGVSVAEAGRGLVDGRYRAEAPR